ncbi:hypothetical protein [Halosegnis sp.]|uniref:hypothetical protein n=1 Tax=Halosegnis sp. TaxID=2864959 RepID=UPI0035D43907
MSRRGRRVPEAAPLLGVVLAFGVGGFGLLFAPPASRLAVAGLALGLLYGLTGYGIVRSSDPAAAIPPDAVLAAGALAGAILTGYGIIVGQAAVGLLVGLGAAAPAAAYHARYGDRLNPLTTDQTLLVAIVAAVGLVGLGVGVGRPGIGVLSGALLLLAAADYQDVRGGGRSRRVEVGLVAATFGGSVVAIVGFAAAGRSTVGLLVGAALLVVGAYLVLGRERPRQLG